MPNDSEMCQDLKWGSRRRYDLMFSSSERLCGVFTFLRSHPHPKAPGTVKSHALFLICLCFTIHFASCIRASAAIDCFKCVSINGNNSACEDPFHNNYSTSILQRPCMAGRKHRQGLYPATACIKLAGVYANERVVVRACALDSGGLTTDTEIIRVSHCGGFYFQKKYFRGCLQSCDDVDGCNGVPGRLKKSWHENFVLMMSFFSIFITKSLLSSVHLV